MKADINYIPQEVMLKIARSAGCNVEEMKSFYKVSRNGASQDQLIYIAKTANVGRVDLSGIDLKELNRVRYLGGEKFGRVHYQLRFDLDVDVIKENFKDICSRLGTFVELPKTKRGRPVALKGSTRDEIKEVVKVIASETAQQTIDRLVAELEKKRKMAEQYGGKLHSKTEREYAEKIEQLRKQLSM